MIRGWVAPAIARASAVVARVRAWGRAGTGAGSAGSGPRVAWLFHRLLALVFLDAWLSLAWQIRVLIGPRGLMPLRELLAQLEPDGVPLLGYPSLLRWGALAGDGALLGGTLAGAALAVVALLGVRPRVMFAVQGVLYLSYAAACRTFLAFQWDNLLLECALLASFLPANRPAPVVHLLFRVLLFKLYFESGLAKWQSHLRDWHDGSAMSFYYETAPLPTWLGWYAHQMPAWWHRIESWATLAFELGVPLLIFFRRRARLFAAGVFTVFQIANASTANYGFFCYLACALHVFLVDEEWVGRAAGVLGRREPPRTPRTPRGDEGPDRDLKPEPLRSWRSWRPWRFIPPVSYVLISTLEAFVHFAPPGAWLRVVAPIRHAMEPLRIINAYHLFGSITRERIEPTFETLEAGGWREQDLRHKAGDPTRPPGFVAPHQPRVDFQLWFHGLSYTDREPLYVANLARRLCHDPAAVQVLFRAPLPARPQAVRISYHRYQFTTAAERRATGAWWRRTLVDTTPPFSCDR